MRIWVIPFLVLFVAFFGTAELYPWLKGLVGSPPGALAAGVLLAIASNLDKLLKKVKESKPQTLPNSAQAPVNPVPSVAQTQAPSPQPLPRPNPNSSPATPPVRSISFTIKKPGS